LRVAETEDFDRRLSLLGEKGFASRFLSLAITALAAARICPVGGILLETDLEGIRKVAGEAADVAMSLRASYRSPGHRRRRRRDVYGGGKRFEPAILGEVDILIFVGRRQSNREAQRSDSFRRAAERGLARATDRQNQPRFPHADDMIIGIARALARRP